MRVDLFIDTEVILPLFVSFLFLIVFIFRNKIRLFNNIVEIIGGFQIGWPENPYRILVYSLALAGWSFLMYLYNAAETLNISQDDVKILGRDELRRLELIGYSDYFFIVLFIILFIIIGIAVKNGKSLFKWYEYYSSKQLLAIDIICSLIIFFWASFMICVFIGLI